MPCKREVIVRSKIPLNTNNWPFPQTQTPTPPLTGFGGEFVLKTVAINIILISDADTDSTAANFVCGLYICRPIGF